MLDLIAAQQTLRPDQELLTLPEVVLTLAEPVVSETPELQEDQGRSSRGKSIKQAIPARRVIYGQVHTGAPLFLYHVSSPYLWVGYLVSDGEISAIDGVEIGGIRQAIADGKPENITSTAICSLASGAGSVNQAIDSLIDTGITAKPDSYRQQGIARVVTRMHYGNDSEEHDQLWGGGDVFQFTVQGVMLTRPWVTGDTPVFRNGPVVCLYDYLTRDWPGAIASDMIDMQSLDTASYYCALYLFSINGVVYADQPIHEVINHFLQACDGVLDFYNGKYHLVIDRPDTSVLTLIDDDFISPVQYEPARGLDAAPNIIRATYYTLDGAAEIVVKDQERIDEEGERQEAIDLLFVSSESQAISLTTRRLKKYNRHYVNVTIHDAGLMLKLLDVVTLQSDVLPAISGEYKIMARSPILSGVGLVLASYDPDHYEV